jgi:hypothetical protein
MVWYRVQEHAVSTLFQFLIDTDHKMICKQARHFLVEQPNGTLTFNLNQCQAFGLQVCNNHFDLHKQLGLYYVSNIHISFTMDKVLQVHDLHAHVGQSQIMLHHHHVLQLALGLRLY